MLTLRTRPDRPVAPSATAAPSGRAAAAAVSGGGTLVVAVVGLLLAHDRLLGLVTGAAVLGAGLLAVPLVRRWLATPALLPLLLVAPSAASVYPAVAVPLTTGLLLLALLAPAQVRLLRPMVAGLALAGVVGLSGVAVGLAHGWTPSLVAGDALQFLGLPLAALVAARRDPQLLRVPTLVGLAVAMLLVSAANATGRVDFLAAPGSDLKRNINFVAPVVLVWGLVHLLWRPAGRTVTALVAVAGLLTLLGFTRGIWAGAAVAAAVVVAWFLLDPAQRRRRLHRLSGLVGLLLVGTALTVVLAPGAAAIAHQKVASLFERQVDYTYQQRGFESEAVLAQRGKGAFGKGFGADYVVPVGGTVQPGPRHYVHNQYVAHLFRNGVAGTALTALSLLLLLRLRRGGPGSALALGTLAYALVTGITSPALFTYPTNLLVGLAVGGAVWADGGCARSRTARSTTRSGSR